MAGVSLQASASCEFRWGSKPGGGRLKHGPRQLNSVQVSSSGVGAGQRGGTGSLLGCEDFIQIGLSKGQSPGKRPSRVRGRWQGWWCDKNRSSGGNKREIVSAVDGQSRYGETAKDTTSEAFSRGGNSRDFFVGQGHEYDRRDSVIFEDPAPEGVLGVNGKVRNVIPDEESMEERWNTQGEAEQTRGRGRPEARGSRTTNRGPGNVTHEDDMYAWDHVSATESRKKTDRRLDRTTHLGFDEETLEEEKQFVKSPFVDYEGDSETYRGGSSSDRSMFLQQGEGLSRYNGEAIADSLGPSGRDDDRAYASHPKETTRNLPFQKEDDESKLDAWRGEELWQGSNRREAEAYPSSSVMDSRSQAMDTENSTSILMKGPDYDYLRSQRGTTPKDLEVETVGGKWSPVLARGALCAKQVISQATAQILGIVTQLWVDMESLKVVALEVRPNLLSGSFNSILLKNLSKVGDVILIHDENSILDNLNLFNCSDLVGSDLFTENGFCLGKVRDYDFSLDNGTLISLEFDTFGVPLIPSPLVSTYSLTVDEVIEAQEDCLLVQNGAETRVRKLTKGLFSRVKPPFRRQQSLTKERRKRLQLNSGGSSGATAAEVGHMGSSMGRAGERVGGVLQRHGDRLQKASPSGEQLHRESIYSHDTREVLSDSPHANKFESDIAQELYPRGSISSRKEYFRPEKWEDYQSASPIRQEAPIRNAPDKADSRRTQAEGGARRSTPEVGLKSRGLPMSYRTSKKMDENDA